MPLSEHEQRLLEQMERALSADDPKFANAMRGSRHGRAARRRLVLGIAAVVVGLVLLVVGASTSQIWLGAGGFIVMLAGAIWAFSPARGTGPRADGQPDAAGPRPPRPGRTRRSGSFMERMEHRWDRRRGGGQW
ncbi:DUF3040 domain-containing protein [Paenibacillus sp. TRM 82003]|uniref:DUF3040 domain-containing protein n=1 Tax=Kineococcus sp. TRM81007 TaxID=2925831 RepID=UPI001F57490A|nr:DUF3040 domain-containing protein [Kineococcus sp. TRM81007]MCI2239692.1 DUF3040 domain-containing protein [Kineococcus sp. TRM81007]MCI3926745.1 DUF3040 domain-containing protein [Paenibacillus sp. TRM 82003]